MEQKIIRHEVQEYPTVAALQAETIAPTNNDEVHIEALNRRFNWLQGASTAEDGAYVINQVTQTTAGRWVATAVEAAKVYTGSVSTGAIGNGQSAIFDVILTGSGTLLATSGAAVGVTNGGTFPLNVLVRSIVLTSDNTASVEIANESGADVAAFTVTLKATDFTGVAQAAVVVANPPQFGNVPVTTASYQSIPVTFATPFPAGNIPFVTLTSHVKKDLFQWAALNITNLGFALQGQGVGTNNFAGDIGYKVEITPN